LQFKDAEKKATMLYDIITYHTMLKYVFNIDAIDEAVGKDPNIYLKRLSPLFELSFLDEKRKVKKLVDNLS
jgi:hypothetical protein